MAYKNKTVPTSVSPSRFLDAVENAQRRADGHELMKMMRDATGERPVMWGSSIVGFGRYDYETASGHKGEIMLVGFSPRKQNLVLYIGSALDDETLMAKLGKHKRGKGCLYINKLDDVDREVLGKLLAKSAASARRRIPAK